MRKLIILTLVISLALSLCVHRVEESEQFNKTKQMVESLNIQAYGYSKKVGECYVNYSFRIDKVDSKIILRFRDLDYNCKSLVYPRLKVALRNATLVDTGEFYYLHTPSIVETRGYVVKYRVRDSILRYEGLPVIPTLYVIDTFDHAENVKIQDEFAEFDYHDPYVGDTHIRMWIKDDIPIRVEFYFSNYNVTVLSEITNYTIGYAEDFDLSGYEVVER